MNVKFTFLLLALLLTACGQQSDDSPVQGEQAVNSKVLAKVNGEAITQDDVDFMISRTFSGSEKLFSSEEMQAKVLDSLIASKAMQQKMLATLSEEKLADIKNRANAFEEELLIKEYLTEFSTPKPVSSKMVQNYYQQNPEEFGGGERRAFEMLATIIKPTEGKRDAILAAAQEIKNNTAWQAFGESNDLGLSYKQATMQPGLFAPALERAIKETNIDQASDIVLIKGVPHIVRVQSVNKLPARPLSEVSSQIRKKLAALQLKKSVKSASESAISDATVERK